MGSFYRNDSALAHELGASGWALCNGATLPINQWQAVFALIGTTYGGNGTTNFQLPNLQRAGDGGIRQRAGSDAAEHGGHRWH